MGKSSIKCKLWFCHKFWQGNYRKYLGKSLQFFVLFCIKFWIFFSTCLCTNKMCLTVFVFINAPGNPPYMGKTLQKSEKNILQISHLIFWMLRATKYLICDFTFTSFLFIRSKLNWPLFSFIWNICTRKNYGQGWNYHLKYFDVEKMVGKVPKSLMI